MSGTASGGEPEPAAQARAQAQAERAEAAAGAATAAADAASPEAEDTAPYSARETYRRRRLMDAARLLPAVGLVLVMFPLLWLGEDTGPRTRTGVIYLFAVWAGLIAAAVVISWRLSRPLPPGRGDEGDDVV